jgi:hypothetical protein
MIHEQPVESRRCLLVDGLFKGKWGAFAEDHEMELWEEK